MALMKARGTMSGRLPVSETHRIKAGLIRASGNQCQGCGYQFPKRLNEHQLARDQGAFELDHMVPLKRGGTNRESNLWVLCLPCHDGKTNASGSNSHPENMTESEWRAANSPQDWQRKLRLMQRG